MRIMFLNKLNVVTFELDSKLESIEIDIKMLK